VINPNRYFVYILTCSNGSYYTGYTSDLHRRFNQHVNGTAKCKFTRSFKPLEIAQHWVIDDGKKMAMKIERLIKKLSRKEKEQLILHPNLLAEMILLTKGEQTRMVAIIKQ
jgi:putative endonuclease